VRLDHLDHGRTRVINATARAAEGRYFVLSDGDCIPEPDFLEQHAAARRAGAFLNGRRLMMEGEQWRDLEPAAAARGEHRAAKVDRSRRDIRRLRRKSWWYRALGGLAWHRLRLLGANFSLWRADFEAINGFDEGYVGWGAADEDLRRRLHDAGIAWGDVMGRAMVWHIPHPPVASKPAKVKQGRNASRYDAWTFLTRPVDGLETRAGEDLVVAVGELESPGRIAVAASAGSWLPPVDVRLRIVRSDGTVAGSASAGAATQLDVLLVPRDVGERAAMMTAGGWRGRGRVVIASEELAARLRAESGAASAAGGAGGDSDAPSSSNVLRRLAARAPMRSAGFERDRLPAGLPAGGDLHHWWKEHEGMIRPLLRETATFGWLRGS
jgi:hypothetical protein